MSEQFAAKLPNAMTYAELVEGGKSSKEADQIMHQRVFGADVKFDAKDEPIEEGKGSAKQPTPQHVEALVKANERRAASNPNSAEVIAAAVAAGVQAGIKKANEDAQL